MKVMSRICMDFKNILHKIRGVCNARRLTTQSIFRLFVSGKKEKAKHQHDD
jgi:hypothetical protein